jgi:hypothetical protein
VQRASAPLVLALFAACTEPEGPAFEPTPETAAAPPPTLGETEPLRRALAAAGPEAEALAAGREALAERAAALRERAEGLQSGVVAPERRDRLLEAGGER